MTDRHPIFDLSDRLVDEFAAMEPAFATYAGIAGYDHLWPDLSPAGHQVKLATYEAFRDRLEALPPAENKWDRLAIESARAMVAEAIVLHETGHHQIDLDSMSCPAQTIVDIFDHMDKSSEAGWTNICRRLETMPDVLDGYRQTLAQGLDAGAAVAKRQVEAVIEQSKVAASEDSGLSGLVGEFASSDATDPELAERLAAAAAVARQAQANLAAWLADSYLSRAVDHDGVGEERYIRSARRFLGTDIDPRATYEWGWTQVAELRARMEEVANEIQPGATIEEALRLLKTDPDRTAATRQEFIDFMVARNAAALEQLDGTHFDVPANIRAVDVKLANPGGPLGAYYVGPSEDFSRAGAVWWSHGNHPGPFPLYDEVTTLYHEGFPGHHLQVGLQVTNADRLSRLNRLLIWYPGLGEGWALYAEHLMEQLGYFEKPDYVFGYLSAQMLRACRVVVDIGAHLDLPIPEGQPFHPGGEWTFDVGVEMLQKYATLERPYAESEMTRYLGWPGQAISYKVGEKAIFDMREMLEAADGFDSKQFHADLLAIGPVGLDLVRELLLD